MCRVPRRIRPRGSSETFTMFTYVSPYVRRSVATIGMLIIFLTQSNRMSRPSITSTDRMTGSFAAHLDVVSITV